jgi:hypothetical protein
MEKISEPGKEAYGVMTSKRMTGSNAIEGMPAALR